jgi:hypothetical protein
METNLWKDQLTMDHNYAGSNAERSRFEQEDRHHAPQTHISIWTSTGSFAVRDAIPSDVDAYVRYWHYSGERIKDLLGIDRQKLGTPDDSRKRFEQMIRVPGTEQASVIFTMTVDEKVVGYTNINRYGPEDSYPHLHTYHFALRSLLSARAYKSARNGVGIASVAIGPILAMYFRLFPVDRLVLQTRAQNWHINRALDLYMPIAETRYIANAAGLAGPGEQCLRFVRREDIPWLLSRSDFLNRLDQRECKKLCNRPSYPVQRLPSAGASSAGLEGIISAGLR